MIGCWTARSSGREYCNHGTLGVEQMSDATHGSAGQYGAFVCGPALNVAALFAFAVARVQEWRWRICARTLARSPGRKSGDGTSAPERCICGGSVAKLLQSPDSAHEGRPGGTRYGAPYLRTFCLLTLPSKANPTEREPPLYARLLCPYHAFCKT